MCKTTKQRWSEISSDNSMMTISVTLMFGKKGKSKEKQLHGLTCYLAV